VFLVAGDVTSLRSPDRHTEAPPAF
jgi:hypothetical protein